MQSITQWLARFAARKQRAEDLPRLSERFERWSQRGRGKLLRDRETQLLNSLCARQFGFHACQLSLGSAFIPLPELCIPHQFKLHPTRAGASAQALAEFTQLPIADEQLDWLLVQHLLEFSDDPHLLMREAVRVVRPRGYVVIVIMNPWSLWQWGAWLSQWLGAAPLLPRQRLSAWRVRDWLRLLDLTLVDEQPVDFLCPSEQVTLDTQLQCAPPRRARVQWWRDNPFTSVARVLIARKDVAPLIPIKPLWKILRPAPQWASARQSLWRLPLRAYAFAPPAAAINLQNNTGKAESAPS